MIALCRSKYLSILLFIFFLCFVIYLSIGRPLYNWDLVAYTAATLADGEKTAEDLHGETWSIVRATLPKSHFEQLTTDDKQGGYRQEQYRSPESLLSMMPLYDVKMGYVLLLKVLSHFMNPVHSMMFVSGASICLLAFLIFAVSFRLDGILSLTWLPVLGLLQAVDMARALSPDGLAVLLYAMSTYFLLGRRLEVATGFMILGLFVRPDNIILNLSVAVLMLNVSRLNAGVLATASVAVYLLATDWAGHIGWWPQFYFTLIDIQGNLVGFEPSFDLFLYLRAVVAGIKGSATMTWPYATVAALIPALILLRRPGQSNFTLWVTIVFVLSAIIRFMVFPFPSGRVFGPHIIGTVLVLLHTLSVESRADAPITDR